MTEKIDELFFELYTRLEPDDVIAYLRKHMSPSTYQKIDNDTLTNLEKSKELLNWLTKKPNVYPDFLKALKISKQEDLYNLLEGENTGKIAAADAFQSLYCPKCFERYNTDNFLPYTLACRCNYVLCLACVKKLEKENCPVICPSCRSEADEKERCITTLNVLNSTCSSCSKLYDYKLQECDHCQYFFCSSCLRIHTSEIKGKELIERLKLILKKRTSELTEPLYDEIEQSIEILSRLKTSVAGDAFCIRFNDTAHSINHWIEYLSEQKNLIEFDFSCVEELYVDNAKFEKYMELSTTFQSYIHSISESISYNTVSSAHTPVPDDAIQNISKLDRLKSEFPILKIENSIRDGYTLRFCLIQVKHEKIAVVGIEGKDVFLKELTLDDFRIMNSYCLRINDCDCEILGCYFQDKYRIFYNNRLGNLKEMITVSTSGEINRENSRYTVVDICANNISCFILEKNRILQMDDKNSEYLFNYSCAGKITSTFNAKVCCVRNEPEGLLFYSFDFGNDSPLICSGTLLPGSEIPYFLCQAKTFEAYVFGKSKISDLLLLDKKGNTKATLNLNRFNTKDVLYIGGTLILLSNEELLAFTKG